MIALTTYDNELRWFNPNQIAAMQERPNFRAGDSVCTVTYVWVGGGEPHIVLESLEQINALIAAAS